MHTAIGIAQGSRHTSVSKLEAPRREQAAFVEVRAGKRSAVSVGGNPVAAASAAAHFLSSNHADRTCW